MTTAGAAKPREPHRHRAKQRCHPTKPPVLDVTGLTASRAIRTQNRVIVGLHGDHRLLQARQDLLCLGQRQPQVRDIAESTERPDIRYVDHPCRTVDPRFNQAQDPRHPQSPSQQTIGQSYRLRPHSPTFWTLPKLDAAYPTDTAIRLILDNHSAHISTETKTWLAAQPEGRFTFVFTPKHGSWLNLVEGFFSKMARSVLRRIRVKSKDELKARILAYLDDLNREPVIHTWTYKIDTVA
jgi:transposase